MRNLTCGLALAGLILASLPTGAETPAPAPLSADPSRVPHGAYALDTAHGKITWSVNHLGFSTYYGQIPDVTGELELDPRDPSRSRLTVRIGTASIDGRHKPYVFSLRAALAMRMSSLAVRV